MGTFENIVKLNEKSILGNIIDRIKNKISLEDVTTNTLTLTLDDFTELSSGYLGYKITPPDGTYVSEIDVNILANRSTTSASPTYISINHGNVNDQITLGSSVVGIISTASLSFCTSSHSFYNPNSKVATGFLTSALSTVNHTDYTNTTTTSVNRSSYSSVNDGSITIITDETNLSDITINIMYKLSKS